MPRLRSENGVAMIMILAVTVVLAVLAATVVIVTMNTGNATADVRTRTSALYYAQAGLKSGVLAVETQAWPSATTTYSSGQLTAAFSATYTDPSWSGENSVLVQVYDNQSTVNKEIKWDQGSPTGATTPDGKFWVQSSVTYNHQTAIVRQLVASQSVPGAALQAGVAVYSGQNVVLGTGRGSPGISFASVQGGVYAGGYVAVDSNATINATIHAATNPYLTQRSYQSWTVADHTVPPLSGPTGAFPDSLVQERIAQASTAQSTGTLIGPSVTTNLNYTTPVYTTGDLNVGSSGLTTAACSFQNLWVGGNLKISNNATFACENLHVVGNLTITNTNVQSLGNASIGGNVTLGPGGSTILAPVLVVGGSVTSSNGSMLGTSAAPCMLLMTNSTNTPQAFLSEGGTQVTGVVANLTGGTSTLDNGDRYIGSLFSAGTVQMLGDAQVTFDGDAVGTWTTQSTRVVAAAMGTWQELSPSGN